MIQSPLSVVSEGYLCPGPFMPLAIATNGYICLVVVVEVPLEEQRGGNSAKARLAYRQKLDRLNREDDEVSTVFMISVIYGYLE